jgi:hypothetical protein
LSNLMQLNCRAVKLFGASLRLTPLGLAWKFVPDKFFCPRPPILTQLINKLFHFCVHVESHPFLCGHCGWLIKSEVSDIYPNWCNLLSEEEFQ